MACVLLHTLIFPPDQASNAYVFGDLALQLSALGHKVIVLTTTPHYNALAAVETRQPRTAVRGRWLWRSDFAGICCYHVRVASTKGSIFQRLRTMLRFHLLGIYAALSSRFKCDVVLSQSPPLSLGLIGAWIAKRHGAKAIYVAQDLFPDNSIRQDLLKNPLLIGALRALERLVYAQSDAVTSICEGMTETLRSRVSQRTILRTIPNFVDTHLYRPLPRDNEFAYTHGLQGRFVVSYVGNLGNAQDFRPMLAAAEACADLPIRFLLVGGGIKRDTLRAEAMERQLANVEVWDYQPRETTPWINASSDLSLVLLAPHVSNGSFPSKIYTIMACGKPILLYGDPNADAARFVRDNEIGWVVPNGDVEGFVAAIRHLHQNRAECEKRGSRGVTLVQTSFSTEAVAEKYNALINDLCGQQGKV